MPIRSRVPGLKSTTRLGSRINRRTFAFTPAESALILPDTAIWVSQQGVTQAGTVSSWASYLGGISSTVTQAVAGQRPAYSASGGVGGRPLITFDGVDDILEGGISKGTAWTTHEIGVVGARVAFATNGDTIAMMHQGGGFIGGVRDVSASRFHYTTAAQSALSTSGPDADNAFWHGSDEPNNVEVRRNGVVEAANTAASSSSHTDVGLTAAVGGRVATAAYANWALQAVAIGVRLTTEERAYLRALLTHWTGITC